MAKNLVKCIYCDGRGFTYTPRNNGGDSTSPTYIDYNEGCSDCGGSGRKAIGGDSVDKKALREDTLVKGSGMRQST